LKEGCLILMIEPERLNKRSLQALESKKRIFNSAIDLFNEFGFENVTIDNICKRTGASTGLFIIIPGQDRLHAERGCRSNSS
jgi:hypothetical protein